MLSIIIRTVIMYLIVTLGIRFMGKRQIGDMQPNELVITLLISEIAAIPLQDTKQPIIHGIVAIFILVILEITVSVITMKSFTVRKILSGKSAVIIKNGVIDQKTMRDVRMTILDLVELLRGKDVFKIEDVAFAILEVNGDLSVMLKSEMQPIIKKDLNITDKNEGLPLPVILDGKIVFESVYALDLTKNKFENILKSNNINVGSTFLMTMDRYHNYSLVRKNDKK